jgi:hypothetical protein
MRKALRRLADLQKRLAQRAEANALPEKINCLCVTAVAGRLHLDFFGGPFDEPFQEVLAAVVTPDVATVLASLTLRGPDEGANGTRNWDLSPLASSGAGFPQLRAVSIAQTQPADHNRSIVAADYEEGSVLARLLARAPALESLVTPSAPDADFFRVGERPLQFLSVDAGYDTQGFIRNLAQSSCFPGLRCLEFGEYNETYMEDYAVRCTPFADYQELFGAATFRPVRRFVWRNPACSAAEVGRLKALRPDLQLLVVRTSATYVK